LISNIPEYFSKGFHGILVKIRKYASLSAPIGSSSIYQLFDSFKFQLTGRLHEPHAHFIENGIHSITLTSSGKQDAKISPL
jgi:hypothetical protein